MCILFLCREEASGSAVSACRPELEKGTTRRQVALASTAMELHIHRKSMLTSFTVLVEDSWLITL